MKIGGHPRQGGHGFSLASGGDQDGLLICIILQLLDLDQGAFRDIDIAQLCGCPNDIDHTAAFHHHLPSVLVGRIDDLLDPVHVGGKGGHDNAVCLVLREDGIKGLPHRPF